MRLLVSLLAVTIAPLAARADEGMWTFDAFPKDRVQQKYGFAPSDAWLEHARLSSVRLAGGCSASFVSPQGLVATNHHCAQECIQALSTAEQDLFANGFFAKTGADERRCPDVEVNQLVAITPVTDRMRKATAGRTGEAFKKALDAEKARIERACQTSADLLCEVVTLYRGGVYDLYTYRRYQDVRLVFAPEFRIAFFGGDPDNFEFPRYDLDVSFLRVYANGKPLQTKSFFRWSADGPQEGELVFVAGNPGRTSRLLTVAQLAYLRDFDLPERIARFAELRGLLTGFQLKGAEERRISTELLFAVENSLKAYRGEWDALRDAPFFASLAKREDDLRAKLAASPGGGRDALAALDAIAKAQGRKRALRVPYSFLETSSSYASRPAAFPGELFAHARTLVRAAAERAKPDDERLPELTEAALPAVKQTLLSEAPVYPELERLRLGHGLTKLREALGTDDPVVRRVLGKESPDELAARLVSGTKLADPAVRRALWDGGAAAVAASDDPMIAFARLVDPDARAVRRTWEGEVDSVERRNGEVLAEARFAALGRSTYPDATFSPRLSYGTVKGWQKGDRWIPPFTVLAGAYERATGRDPYKLPDTWIRAKEKLHLQTRFDLVTTNDIIGGNSGSPLFDRQGRFVGLVFDGNIESLGGDFGFDEAVNRTVAVDSAAILEALAKVYGATRLVEELAPERARRR
jgi:hypothetical protein